MASAGASRASSTAATWSARYARSATETSLCDSRRDRDHPSFERSVPEGVVPRRVWEQIAKLGHSPARPSVVVLTFDIDVLAGFWMIRDYLPEALTDDRERFPAIDAVADILGDARVEPVPIPADCEDGFFEAHYARPEAYLDPALRAAQSVWPRLPDGAEQRALAALSTDLDSGAWDERHGHLRA
jgi:hypothetical protein